MVDKTKKRNSRLIAEVENTTLEGNNNNKPNLQVYEAARCYSEPKNSKTHPSQEGAVLVLLPACLEESGTNSSARSLAGSGSEQRSSASSCTTSTSSSSASPASASDNNKNERARFSTDQRIPSLQTVASAPIVQGQFSQEQDANNVKNSQKQQSKDQVIPNNNSANVLRNNSKEAVTVATSSVMFVNSPPKSCKYLLTFCSFIYLWQNFLKISTVYNFGKLGSVDFIDSAKLIFHN